MLKTLIAAIAAWIVLVLVLHIAVFALTWVCRARGMSVPQIQRTTVYRVICHAGAVLLFPVFYPVVVARRIKGGRN